MELVTNKNCYSWNNFYKKEQDNFNENEEDTGECWFDDSDAESKMIQFIIDKLNEEELPEEISSQSVVRFLDLGTGNMAIYYFSFWKT